MIQQQYKLPPVIRKILYDVTDSTQKQGDVSLNVDRLNTLQRYNLIKAILGYTLHLFKFDDGMVQLLQGSVVPTRKMVTIIRQRCFESFDLNVRVKNVIYKLLSLGINNKEEVLSYFNIVGLTEDDAQLYMWLSDLDLQDIALDKLNSAVDDFYLPHRVELQCKRYERRLKRSNYIIKYINKKHSFITRHNDAVDKSDIEHELLCLGIAAFYFYRPFISFQHAFNTMKRIIHDRGVNIIEYYTSEKRAQLVANDSGFHTMQNTINKKSKDGSVFETNLSSSDYIYDEEDKLLLKLSVKVLVKKQKGKRLKALKLLMREDDRTFLKFVSDHEDIIYNSVDEFYNACIKRNTPADFQEAIRQYVKIDRDKFKSFIKEIEKDLVI